MPRLTELIRLSDPRAQLYRTYWALVMSDACIQLEVAPTKENKRRLHEAHKKIYGCESTSGFNYEEISKFVNYITGWYAQELGITLRTSGKQPENLDDLPLSESWNYL